MVGTDVQARRLIIYLEIETKRMAERARTITLSAMLVVRNKIGTTADVLIVSLMSKPQQRADRTIGLTLYCSTDWLDAIDYVWGHVGTSSIGTAVTPALIAGAEDKDRSCAASDA